MALGREDNHTVAYEAGQALEFALVPTPSRYCEVLYLVEGIEADYRADGGTAQMTSRGHDGTMPVEQYLTLGSPT